MKYADYVEDHAIYLLTCILCLIMQSFVLYFLGNNIAMICLLDGLWAVFFILFFFFDFMKKKKRYAQILYANKHLDKKYLLHEVLPKGGSNEERFFQSLLYIGNKAMMEEVSSIQRERSEYQEYIEQWVHEIKTPISAMKLWSENQQVDRRRDLMQQLERTEHYVEQALYYARCENVNKDFHIHKVDLAKCIQESLLENKYLCMSSHVQMEIPQNSCLVYCDEKWIIFILNQLIENAVKYRREENAKISITTETVDANTLLHVRDNGIGICAQDLPRIFEKGFTGMNGRQANRHSTGIGLYLCKRLCDALNVELSATSSRGEGSEFTLKLKSYRTVTAL